MFEDSCNGIDVWEDQNRHESNPQPYQNRNQELVAIGGQEIVKSETDKAMYVFLKGLGMHWVPKSQTDYIDREYLIPRWLYKTKQKSPNNLTLATKTKSKVSNARTYPNALTLEDADEMYTSMYGADYHQFPKED